MQNNENMTSLVLDKVKTVHQEETLWIEKNLIIMALQNSPRTTEEDLAKNISREAPAESMGIVVEKDEARVWEEAKAMDGTTIIILVIDTIAQGVLAKVEGVKGIGEVSTDRNFIYPGHPPNLFINGLKG